MTTTPQLTPETAERILAGFRQEALAATTDQEAQAVADRLEAWVRSMRARQWEAYPWQAPHNHPDGWVSQVAPGRDVCDTRCLLLPPAPIPTHGAWLQRGGRGTGKTEGAAHYINAHAEGPPCDTRVPGGHRFTIAAPTQSDAVSSCVEGVSGLKAINPGITITTGREGTIARWPNGSVARLLGGNTAKDVERARAWTNVCVWWLEEAAAMPYLGGLFAERPELPQGMLDQAPFTLRLGSNPHMVITTTPKNRPEVIRVLTLPGPVTWGRTEDAHRLDPGVRESLETMFRGTTLGKQELDGDLIADTPGALWVSDRPALVDGEPNKDERPGIGNHRLTVADVGWVPNPRPPGLRGDGHTDVVRPDKNTPTIVARTVVAVDPPGGRTECGIVIVGSSGQDGYVLGDLSTAAPAATWARIVLEAFYDYGAEGLAVELTYGGDMVTETLAGAAERAGVPAPPIFKMRTKVGKRLRAEPVAALYQQGRCVAAGELVTTERGLVPIQDVRAGDRALTRSGWRAVEWAGQTDFRDTVRVTGSDGSEVICTPDHPVMTSRGWVHAGMLVDTDILVTCTHAETAEHLSRSPEFAAAPAGLSAGGRPSSPSGSTKSTTESGTTSTTRAITGVPAAQMVLGFSCTGRFGRTLTAPFQKAGTSTTGTTTAATTPWETSSPSVRVITRRTTTRLASSFISALTKVAPRSAPVRRLGGLLGSLSPAPVTSAAPSSTPRPPVPGSAPRSATAPTGTPPVRVVSVSPAGTRPVYDLTVETDHEFFAGGILVHNCHHRGFLDGLETEMRTWIPDQTTESPNRVDALVHGLNYLLIGARAGTVANPVTQLPARMPTTFGSTGSTVRRR